MLSHSLTSINTYKNSSSWIIKGLDIIIFTNINAHSNSHSAYLDKKWDTRKNYVL